MAEGSPQTIDRIQVEINFNSGSVDQELTTIGSKIDNTKIKLSTLETTSCSTADCIKNLGINTTATKTAFEKQISVTGTATKSVASFGSNTNDAAGALRKFNGMTKLTGEDILDLVSSSKKAGDSIERVADAASEMGSDIDWIPDAATQMEKLGTKTQGFGEKAKSAASAIKSLKGGLAALGVTAGIVAIVNKFKEMAEKARDASDAYNKIKTDLISYTGELNKDQLSMVESIYINSPTSTGFTDKDQVTKAVGSVVTLWKDATAKAQQEIATELSTLQALGRISDTGSFAQTAKGTFQEWGIGADQAASSMEYLYYVSQQTGVGMSEMTSFLNENAETFKKMGLTMQEAAQLIGNSFNSVGSMKDIENMMSDYTTNYDDRLDQLKTEWQDAHEGMEMPADVLAKLEKDAENWAVAQANAYGAKLKSAFTQAQAEAVTSGEAWANIVLTDQTTSEKIRENKNQNKQMTAPVTAIDYNQIFQTEVEAVRKKLSDYNAEGFLGTGVNEWIYQLKSSNVEGNGKTLDEVLDLIDQKYGGIEVPVTPTADKTEAEKAINESVPDSVTVKAEVDVETKSSGKEDKDESGGIDYKDATKGLENYASATEEATEILTPFLEEVLTPMNTSLETQGINLTYNYDENVLLNDYSTNTLQPTFITEAGVVNDLAAAYERLAAAKAAAGAA